MSARRTRRALLLLAAFLVSLYFCIILAVVSPGGGRSTGGAAYWPGLRDWPPRSPVDWCRGLRRASSGGAGVALASHPGSGNTWLRYLLQQATGVMTGSIYLDYSLRSHGFPAENVTDGSVLVVKTHETHARDADRFRAAVLLVRNPRDAILADFNRLHKGHIGTAPKRAFVTAREDRLSWSSHVKRQTRDWEKFHRHWLLYFPRPLYILHYEHLTRDTRAALLHLLHFLNQTVSPEALECAMSRKEGIYRRRRRHEFDPFTRAMSAGAERARSRVGRLVEERARRAVARAGHW